MREIIAGFSFVEEPDILWKIAQIADTCYPMNGYCPFPGYDGNPSDTPKKLISDYGKLQDISRLSMLEHGNAVFEMRQPYYDLCKWHSENVGCNQMRFTKRNDRYLVSGSLYSWFEFAESVYTKDVRHFDPLNYPYLSHIFCAINKNIGGILDQFLKTRQTEIIGINMISDMSALTEEERMIHECPTVRFKVSRDVAHMLCKARNASTAEIVIPDEVLEPLFFADTEEEEPDICTFGEASASWEVSVRKALETYEKLISLGVSHNDASSVLPGSVAVTLYITMNLKEWRKALESFQAPNIYYGVQEVIEPLVKEMTVRYPFMF